MKASDFGLGLACLGLLMACASGDREFTGGSGPSGGGNDDSGSPLSSGRSGTGSSSGSQGSIVLFDASTTGRGGDGSALGTAALSVTIRDFKFWDHNDPTTNPDFENTVSDDHGNIVADVLGADHKPIYRNTMGMTATTHGQQYFDQWYHDVPGTNINRQYPIALTAGAQGTFGYDSLVSGVTLSQGDPRKMWFPIDDGTTYATPFGNQGQAHNYSFTTELHTVFVYNGGETFAFSGDDDVFVFIANKLVIDLGGVHPREQASLLLDSLGLVKGQQYPLDLFNAERHTSESNLSFTTTLHLQPLPQ